MTSQSSLLPVGTPRAAFGALLKSEARMAWRVPVGLLLGVVTPFLVLIIFGVVPGLNKPIAALGGLTYFGAYFPIILVLVITALSLISLPLHLASYREQGILRRLSTTPVPPAWMLGAQVVVNLALAVAALGVIVVAGTTAFGLEAPRAPAGFALVVVLTIAAMFSIGLWVSAIARSSGAASAIGQLLVYPLLFTAGLWVPREAMNPTLRHIGDFSPLGASVQALQSAMHGTFPSAVPLLVLLAYAVVFGFLAVRFFTWE